MFIDTINYKKEIINLKKNYETFDWMGKTHTASVI
jgi:hypothetical protein